MAKLILSDIERLMLANQYEILAALKEEPYYDRLATQLRDGHEWLYSQSFDSLSDNLSVSQTEYVLQVLGIFRTLKDSYDHLEDKSGIEPNQVEFPGFDGNNEAELLLFSRALRNAGIFSDTIPEHGKNSHMPTTALYQRIIEKWEELGGPDSLLSKDQLLAVLEARRHPDNRR